MRKVKNFIVCIVGSLFCGHLSAAYAIQDCPMYCADKHGSKLGWRNQALVAV